MAVVTTATYIQRGESLDYKNGGDAILEAGTVVSLGSRIAVTGAEIAPGAVGSVHVTGVFQITKTESEEVAMGDALYFDADAGKITKEGDGKVPAGFAAAPSAGTETTVLVNIGFPPAAGAAAAAAAKPSMKLTDLTDVEGEPSEGQVLTWQTEKWKPAAAAKPAMALDDLSDVNAASPSEGDTLTYSSSAWINKAAGGA